MIKTFIILVVAAFITPPAFAAKAKSAPRAPVAYTDTTSPVGSTEAGLADCTCPPAPGTQHYCHCPSISLTKGANLDQNTSGNSGGGADGDPSTPE